MTTKSARYDLFAVALALVAGLTSLPAADVVAQAREILNRNQASLVTVSALSKLDLGAGMGAMGLGGLGEAQETTCAGLVIDESGLTVVSYTALNPMDRISGALGQQLGEDVTQAKPKTEVSRVQMRLPDGTEFPARLVLKDKELDLAFLVPDPKEGDKKPTLTPTKVATDVAAQELDDVVVLSRHGKEFGYAPGVTLSKITSVIKKPRPLYDLSVMPRPGAPVFLPDGRWLGVTVTLVSSEPGLLGMGEGEMLVLPASEVAKAAEQARKAAEKKSSKSDK